MMLCCWDHDGLRRPRFKQIVNDLDILLKSKKENFYSSPKNSK